MTTYITPKSLLLHGDSESGLVVDHHLFFHKSTPYYILLHILNALESLPTSAWKSTGMFAANVYKWHQEQMQEDKMGADEVLMKLLQISSNHIFTPQTAFFAIRDQSDPGTALGGASFLYVSHVLQDPAVVQSSLSLVVPFQFQWMRANEQLATTLLPQPETPRDHERQIIQSNLMFFFQSTQFYSTQMTLEHCIASTMRGRGQLDDLSNHSEMAFVTLIALLDMQYDEHLTVAESIIISMHDRELTEYTARLVDLAVESGQRIDSRQARYGVSVRDAVLSMEKYLNGPKHNLVNMNLYMSSRLQLQMLELKNQLRAIRRKQQTHFYTLICSGPALKESSE